MSRGGFFFAAGQIGGIFNCVGIPSRFAGKKMITSLRCIIALAAVSCALFWGGAALLARGRVICAAQGRLADELPPQVRMRRLHLMRPDLIPYPIEIEVDC
jgi:hypothetical protein